MGNYIFAISKPGYDVTSAATGTKDKVILNDVQAHKIAHKGLLAGTTYTHGLGRIPFAFAYRPNTAIAPTYYSKTKLKVNATQVKTIATNTYIIVMKEGI